MSKLIFGCGYLGSRVARLWRDAGEEVVAVTRSARRAELLAAEGLQAMVADINDASTLGQLPQAETVLFAVGYDRSMPADQRRTIGDVYAGGLANVLDALSESVRRIIYISSTGVYGDAGGEWLDEDSPCEPQREGGHACLAAEEVLRGHRLGDRGVALRLAGIYGPDRVPRLKEISRNEPIEVSKNGMLNLIHVEDSARAVLAAEAHARPSQTYCIGDGHPVLRRDWFREVAKCAGLPEPQFTEPTQAKSTSRASSSKQLRNDRMLSELRIELQYPSYREGLKETFNRG